ncbi:NEDD4 family-interacting protein 1-like [Asterias amurensis]|uniref:NEDD4 family-interacting protein 1-like n=1 Tax=Asterias amurensis TaxID=7602 RepID=UPI003AB5AE08
MDKPPTYADACKDEENPITRVTLALVIPPSSPADTQPGAPIHKDDEEQSIPDEPPPAYDDQHEDDDGDKKPLLPSEQGWTQPTLEEKLVQAGLLSRDDLKEDSGSMLGGDLMFTVAFFIAFLFNWIGFLFAYCLSVSVAGRYGALSGFGASMVKWTLIAVYSDCCSLYLRGATCLLIALTLSGVLVCGRGIYMYLKIKRQLQGGKNIQYVYWQNM